MSPWVTVVLPGVLLGIALWLGRREWIALRRVAAVPSAERWQPPGRAVRRVMGIVLLMILAVAFFSLGVRPPRDASEARVLLGVLFVLAGGLIGLPIVDLVQTLRSSRLRRRALQAAHSALEQPH